MVDGLEIDAGQRQIIFPSNRAAPAPLKTADKNMKTQFIQIPARSFQLDPQNRAHVAKLVRMAESAFNLAAKAWIAGSNSGDTAMVRLMNHRCDRKRAEAEAMLAPLGIKCSYPGLYPAFEVGGGAEYTVEAAVVAALKLPRNFLSSGYVPADVAGSTDYYRNTKRA